MRNSLQSPQLRGLILVGMVGASLILAWNWGVHAEQKPTRKNPAQREQARSLDKIPAFGNPATLRYRYDKWKAARTLPGHVVEVRLAPSKYLSKYATDRSGLARLDLAAGTLQIEVAGDGSVPFDVWLTGTASHETSPGARTRSATLLGRVAREGRFDFPSSDGFKIDEVVLTPPGGTPEDSAALFGTPTLFDRLLAAETQAASPRTHYVTFDGLPAGGFSERIFVEMVEDGAELFTNNEFNGNGRTCASCHRPDNNYTIDPDYVGALLAANEPDALFNEVLDDLDMIKKGLIRIDKGGTHVFRAVPHLLGIELSLQPGQEANAVEFQHDLGWDGEGSVFGDGALADFAIGAITQHFTRTLARNAGSCESTLPDVDFCLPTGPQLRALEAFIKSLGRRADKIDYGFKHTQVEDGKSIFNQGPYGCHLCHSNGGANNLVSGKNERSRLGVEYFLHSPGDLLEGRTFDFGAIQEDPNVGSLCNTYCDPTDPECETPCGPTGPPCDRCDGWFSTTSVIEAADTLPHFHNNATSSLRQSIEFYNTAEFMANNETVTGATGPNGECYGACDSRSGCGNSCNDLPTQDGYCDFRSCCDKNGDDIHDACQLSPDEVLDVARFLSAVNTLDNLETQVAPLIRAAINPMSGPCVEDKLLHLAVANLTDVKNVLFFNPPATYCKDTMFPCDSNPSSCGLGGVDEETIPCADQDQTAREFILEAIAELTDDSGQPETTIASMNAALGAMCGAWLDLVDEPCPWCCDNGCSSTCQDEATCGDGMVDEGEQCDDGDNLGGDGCSPTCTIVENGDFCGGSSPWDFFTNGTTLYEASGGEAVLTIQTAGSNTQIYQKDLHLKGNTEYRVRFRGTHSAGGSVKVSVRKHTGPYTSYGLPGTTLALTASDQLRSVEFTTTAGNKTDARLMFQVGNLASSGTYRFDDVVIEEVEAAVCGDGVIDAGEQCDDGNTTSGDGCSSTCQDEPACGDGTVDAGEQCDDGNTTSGDGCSSTCQDEPACGDGTVDAGEQCDDGNTTSGDGCSSACQLEAICGDGTVDPGEQCDDGNSTNGDGCQSDCTFTSCGVTLGDNCCGDAIVEAPEEECDDGNGADGDGCSSSCQIEVCGNGTVDVGEECDDGNTASDDGCDSNCQIESLGPPIVTNGDFSAGKPPWSFFSDASAVFSVVGGEAKLAIGTAGSNVQLYQYDIAVSGGTQYRLRFRGRSSNGANCDVYLQKHATSFTGYGLSATNVNLTTIDAEYIIEFTTTPGDKTDARLRFSFGPYDSNNITYYLDDIIIEEID